jgi:S-adenosylmethionine:diacylglycerol 3-amino-3-carboxypropyl transferase
VSGSPAAARADAPVAAWQRGRLDARRGPRRILFGRMYEDPAIEEAALRPGGRVFCIASAGCTALALARTREVVAIDLNPAQLEYAATRLAGGPAVAGVAERVMDAARALAPLVGWTPARVRDFLALDDVAAQRAAWRRLDTRRFALALDVLFSPTALRAVYASPLLRGLPPRLGAVMRARLARGFARHPNCANPYARALLAGELPAPAASPRTGAIELVLGDAADWLERAPAGGFDGFTLSNILDGATAAYRARLAAAVRRAAAPGAVAVVRSFGEPAGPSTTNRAADDRAMLWGVVDVRAAADLI